MRPGNEWPHMTDPEGRETFVWPTDLSDPTSPDGLVDLLAGHRLLVLGDYSVPDQLTPEQLHAARDDEASATIESVADAVRGRGVDVESVVVFTRDREETIDRVAADHDADATLTPGSVDESITRVFVPVRGDENLDRIVSFVAELVTGADAGVTLYNAAESEDAASNGEFLLGGAADRLAEGGIDRDRIDWTVARSDDAVESILGAATDHDLLVIGESEPSLRDRILGSAAGRLVEAATQPVAVVRDA